MANPQAIQVHCDGAMDYDTRQTGGNGYVIEFPDFIEQEPITGAVRSDGQGIHRLEMISIVEAMETLLAFGKRNPDTLRKAAAVEIYTDRLSVTDGELINPYRLQFYRKNGWRTHEGKAVKDKDLLDRIDKTRIKLGQAVGGPVTISYERRKQNKVADKLSKEGKREGVRGRAIIKKKRRQVTKRLFEGPEVPYDSLVEGSRWSVRLYAWEVVGDQCEVCFEVFDGEYQGRVVKAYVDLATKHDLHRDHCYTFDLAKVQKHNILIENIQEVPNPFKAAQTEMPQAVT